MLVCPAQNLKNSLILVGEFVTIESTKYWTEIFVKHFLCFGKNENNGKIDSDDLLFFVRKRVNKYSSKMEVSYLSGLKSLTDKIEPSLT